MSKIDKNSFSTFECWNFTFHCNEKVAEFGLYEPRAYCKGENPPVNTSLVFASQGRIDGHVAVGNIESEVKRNVRGNPLHNTQPVCKNQGRIARGCFLAKIQHPKVRPENDSVLHCHPTFKNIPDTPLERRSIRMDRTKHQKSFHVTTFFTVTFLLACLQPVAGLPKV